MTRCVPMILCLVGLKDLAPVEPVKCILKHKDGTQDRDVTCLLFATASPHYKTTGDNTCPRIVTKCMVNLRPIEFNLSEEGLEENNHGHIYGIGLVGCTGMYALLNLMAQERSISYTNTASVLGYCLLPMSLLSLLAAVLSLQGMMGYMIVALAVLWSGYSSSKLFSIALLMNGQKFLVAYPCMLLYSVFALLAIF